MMRLNLFIIISIFTISCNQINNENFEIENQKLINEYKFATEKFISKKTYKLNDNQMLYSLDSIDKLYMVDKNKNLAEKFIETEKGLKRLNFLKKYYTADEINLVISKVPKNQRLNKGFIEIKNYANN